MRVWLHETTLDYKSKEPEGDLVVLSRVPDLKLMTVNSLRAVSLNIGLRATTSLHGKPNNRLVK